MTETSCPSCHARNPEECACSQEERRRAMTIDDHPTKLRTCNACGWVHVGVSRAYAEQEVRSFNDYAQSIDPEVWKSHWGGHLSSIDTYERCFMCGGSYKNFGEAKKGDCPAGCTLNPILKEEA